MIIISNQFNLPSEWSAFVEEKRQEIIEQVKKSSGSCSKVVKEVLHKLLNQIKRNEVSFDDISAICIALLEFTQDDHLEELLLRGLTINEGKYSDITLQEFEEFLKNFLHL